jgi:hypothetical protein
MWYYMCYVLLPYVKKAHRHGNSSDNGVDDAHIKPIALFSIAIRSL